LKILHLSDTGEEVAVYQLFIDSERACASVRKEVLYNILNEFSTNMELFRLVKSVEMKPIVKSA
jgi:hypothetical protein